MNEKLYFVLTQKWKYILPLIKARLNKKNESNNITKLLFIAREEDKDWIFGAKVRKLSKNSSLEASTYFHDALKNIPDADGYYFIHPRYFYKAIRNNAHVLNKKNIVMFTHTNWTSYHNRAHVSWYLNLADYIICLNNEIKKELISIGVKREKLKVIHIASDPNFFYYHERKNGSVGFCSNYLSRKNPYLVYNIIKNMPEKQFIMIGKNWENFDKFDELSKMKNFTYYNNLDYSNYPDLYNKIDVFISPSSLEGGPVPVLEAMLSNCVPVATKTGFCPDVIENGVNGFLFDINADYKEVIDLINEAYVLKGNIRKTALEYSWKNAAKKIDSLFLS